MARSKSSRKYQLTINNPETHGYTHSHIWEILEQFPSLVYCCMCDEIGENKTPHTHVYTVFRNGVMFDTLHKRFYGAHIEPAHGTHQENRDYIRKEGKWSDDQKHETNLPETFEERGEMPPDRVAGKTDSEIIYEMVKDGASNFDILESFPSAMNRLDKIERARQTLLQEKQKNLFRQLEVSYIYGDTGVGKTRSVMEQYGYQNVYRVTNYQHPFDGYKGQDVIVFEEFRNSLPAKEMLNYLDGYPLELPCRYSDRQACYTKVFLITNIPIDKQYPNVQVEEPETYQAFLRRIHHVIYQQIDGTQKTILPVVDWAESPWPEGSEQAHV